MSEENYNIPYSKLEKLRLSSDLEANKDLFKRIFYHDSTLVTRKIEVDSKNEYTAALLFVDGMVNSQFVSTGLISSLFLCFQEKRDKDILTFIEEQVLYSNEVKRTANVKEMVDSMQYGDSILMVSGISEALIINTKGWQSRSISEPGEEKTQAGPREGFTEAILLNTSLIRRKIKNSDMKFEFDTIGRRSNTKICYCYVESLVKKEILNKLKNRIKKIDIDGVLDSNYITELIKDARMSFFETMGTSERPDVVAARLLEGRIALIVDGTPAVITVPYLFVENFQADDDYYVNYYYACLGRFLRILSFIFTVTVPGIYIALMTHDIKVFPSNLAISISSAREGVPLGVIIECLVMIFVFEILREAGIRVPGSMGSALGIVGGLVIGQASVEAKLISAPTVIIIAFTGITGLMLPKLKSAVITLRLLFVASAAALGLMGIYLCSLFVLARLMSLKSFGVDYTSYMLSTESIKNHRDTFVRMPMWKMDKRPSELTDNKIRLRYGEGDEEE